ncbi:MAG: MotA/TolQ/ExbB proton channel family protein [Flavobacteriales bacterium]|nr:MotA/TolQ/ExbB proton channel family protein [Flavobacteriales bacterium]
MDILFFLQESIGGGLQQAAQTTPAINLPEVPQPTTMDQLIKGWYIYVPQLFLSFVAVYIFIERSMALNRADKEETNFMAKLKDYIGQGKFDSAKNLCSTSQTPVARMMEKGISRIGKPLDDISKAIENVGKLEVFKMERNLSILAIIAAIAPMFGFLGTVFGVITIFHDIAEVGSLQISAVSEGLYLKMISSAIGLLVGMIAYIGYNTLVTRVGKVINKMEAHAVEFIDILEQPTN